ncbi:MAG: diaminopimelate epimerase [Sandaracinaceae bacterium]|nr:diaminopimelate epimerase [Sandaracinaceae bacterium]
MSSIPFEKYEGLGNDFVLFEEESIFSVSEVVAICDRHRGVGADGVLFVIAKGGRFGMHVRNQDGSMAQMCGNGLRCVAFHLVRRGYAQPHIPFVIHTDGGPHEVRVESICGREALVCVAMRVPVWNPRALPAHILGEVIERKLPEIDERVRWTALSMGNPHLVSFEELPEKEMDRLAQQVLASPLFPEGINVGFARFERREGPTITLRVFERGVGWTEACGTGACAAVAAAAATGRMGLGEKARVQMPGGELVVWLDEDGRPWMQGPVRYVFSGLWLVEKNQGGCDERGGEKSKGESHLAFC